MYPESLLWWLGGTAILVGLLGLIGLLAWWVDTWHRKHSDKHREDGIMDRGLIDTLLLLAIFIMLLLHLVGVW